MITILTVFGVLALIATGVAVLLRNDRRERERTRQVLRM
jgi:hypothetical protein